MFWGGGRSIVDEKDRMVRGGGVLKGKESYVCFSGSLG